MELQNDWGQKGPLWVIWFNTSAQAGPSSISSPGPCPSRYWRSLMMESPWPPWAICWTDCLLPSLSLLSVITQPAFFSCLLHYTLIKLFVLGLLKHQTVVGTYLWVCDLQWIRETTGVRDDTYGDISQIKVECAMFKFFVVLLRNATSDSYLAFSKPLTPFFDELGTYPFQFFFSVSIYCGLLQFSVFGKVLLSLLLW